MIHPARLRPFVLGALFVLLACCAQAQKKEEVVLQFTGVLKGLTKSQIVIEPDPDNSMTFIRSRRTRIFDGGKETDGAGIKPGTPVGVECVMRMNGDLEALKVTVIDVDQSPNK
jgi:hypothetical protein